MVTMVTVCALHIVLFPVLFLYIQLLSYRCGCTNAIVPDGRECPYEPTNRVEMPVDVSSDVRGLAKWASRLADRVFWDMRTTADIRSMVKSAKLPCPADIVDLTFCLTPK